MILNMKKFFQFIILICISILSLTTLSHYKNAENFTAAKSETIIIFIHGTILPRPSIKSFEKAAKNETSSSFYQKYIDELRLNSDYINQPIGDKGLHKIDLNDKNSKYQTSNKILKKFLESYQQENDNQNVVTLYTFGWDGRLDKTNRENSGNQLYEELTKELEAKKKENIKVEQTEIIAHSHGGNVALYLAKAEDKEHKNLQIDKLIMFGTPIQKETKNFANHPVFKKVYNFYSKGDMVQISDLISTNAMKSERKIFIANSFPKIINVRLIVGKQNPLHTELWFNEIFFLYRKDFLLSPYPVAIFTPALTKMIDTVTIDKTYEKENLLIRFSKAKENSDLKIMLQTKHKKNQKLVSIKDVPNYFATKLLAQN
ncbi:TPA: hypothetical protein DEO28_01475 [Candidatus Dependentiae bacterium]|nr:MAG: hypothetical protein UR14_C0003G0142 [candidate division TM6 bacterium GW2011_GWE2_31_21]KKP53694.1 MAG: hypothetical protein UR43_C0003G0015 [candidate division TM6 bacterium GW2011_GWF2_33_332]HBS48554.1 hypothetical protein [Candidatus Dependentiae bacterium]HBZ73169.1 hypothetical protein [Candidatus Dependentiae bacterium]